MNRLTVQLSTAGMEMCSLSVLAAVSSVLFPLPIAQLSGLLLVSLLLTRLLVSLNRRIVIDAVVHAAGAAAALYVIISSLPGPSLWLDRSVLGLFTLLFWFRGARIGYTDSSYSTTVSRFDIGIGMILFTAWITTVLGYFPEDLPALTGAYLILGIIALYAARSGSASPGFTVSRTPIRILGTVLLAAVFAGMLSYVVIPVFSDSAAAAYITLRDRSAPIGSWLAGLLLRMFRFGRIRTEPHASTENGGMAHTGEFVSSGSEGFIGQVFIWIIYVVLALMVCVLLFTGARALIRFLSRKTSRGSNLSLRALAAGYLKRLGMLLYKLRKRLNRKFLPGEAAFRALCGWGGRSGIVKKRSDTPAEYGTRIKNRIPGSALEIDTIISLVHREWYQGELLTLRDRKMLRSAGRTLRRPKLYPARLNSRFRPGFRQ